MQPEILETPHEANPLEPASEPNTTQTSAAPGMDNARSDALPKAEKKRSRISLAVVAVAVLSLLLLAGVAWVGYWAYQLSTDLTATQQQFSALQAKHEQLQSDYAALTSEKEALLAKLTQADSDLSAAQAELKKAKDENQKLNSRLKKGSALAEILKSFFELDEFSSFVDLDNQIEAAHDSELSALWDEFASSPGEESFGEFLVYLVPAIADALK